MNEKDKLKILFPRASADFLAANAGVCPEKPEPTSRSPLVREASGKAKSDARISVEYVLYRVRLLDPDNAVGATKTITDCLCTCGLIPGDAADQITVEVQQKKVNHLDEQHTELKITYPK